MTKAAKRVKVWRMPSLDGAEMLKGVYKGHSYPWHTHEELCLGTVLSGSIRLETRGQESIAKAGSFVLINSDELHRGLPPTSDGWDCRTMHISPNTIRGIATDVLEQDRVDEPVFNGPVIEDAELSRTLLALHMRTETGSSILEQQTLLVFLVSRLLRNHRRAPAANDPSHSEPKAVAMARAYLDENLADKVTLADLSREADMPTFRLLRSFTRSVGVSPHLYQSQVRVREAHKRLSNGEIIADVSVAVGFADQAHLTRVYKQIMGGTPGQFRMAALAS